MVRPGELLRLRYARFGVDIEADPDTVRFLADLFAPFAADDDDSRAELSVTISRDGDSYELSGLDGKTRSDLSRDAMLDRLVGQLNRSAVDHAGDDLSLHAAVLERDGEALLVLGDTGAGKSTTALGLAGRGWRYMTDEIAWVSPGAESVGALHKPITAKTGTFDLLADLPPRPSSDPERTYIPAARVATTATGRVCPRTVVVLAKPGDDATHGPLPACQAVVAVVRNAFDIDRLGGAPGLRTAADLAARCLVVAIPFADIEARLDAIEAAWATPPPSLAVADLVAPPPDGDGLAVSPDVHGVTIGGGAVLRHDQHQIVTVIDPMPLGLWDAFDGTRTPDQVVDVVAAAHGLDRTVVAADVVAVIERLRTDDVIEGDG